MRASVCTRYGAPDVLTVRDVPKPVPGPNEILVRVHATTVSSGDARLRAANFPPGFSLPARLVFGFRGPRRAILGTDCAGVVEGIGAAVTKFKVGDAVVAQTGVRFGGHAEYATVSARKAVVLKPAGLTFEHAVSVVFGGMTALHFLRGPGRIAAGERVLVNGASGAVGIAAVQLAKHFGAHVTAICSSRNSGIVSAHGADETIDYATTDFASTGERWDIIVDTVGNAPFARAKRSLNANGRLLLVLAGLGDLLKAPFQSMTGSWSVAGAPAPERADDLDYLLKRCVDGTFRPVVERVYSFDQIVEAHARVDTGRKVGSAVVSLVE